MQRLALFFGALALALAMGASYLVASLMANFVETRTMRQVMLVLNEEGFDWVSVRPDGLIVHVSGAAPTEGARFKALIALKKAVNADRIEDTIAVVDPDDLHPPKFSLELLRNGDGISLIGLIPDITDRETVLKSIADVANGTTVTDMLETADFTPPEGWDNAVGFALSSLRTLPRSKISVTADQVTITAITDSQEEKARIEGELEAQKPKSLHLILHISAPRPVITPFSLRLIKDENGVRFDSCSAETAASKTRILAAATKIGLESDADCTIGLGVPSPRWADAVVLAINAVQQLGGGSLTFSDADVTLVAPDTVKQDDFDRIIHDLEQTLPDVFSVHAVLTPKPLLEGSAAKPEELEYSVTKGPEGLVQMRGRMRDERISESVLNFARAQFGSENVHDTTRVDPNLPDGWPLRVLAGLEALAKLHHGSLSVKKDTLVLRGTTDRPEAKTEVTQILSDKLGETSRYEIFVNYDETLNKKANLPTPQECVDRINDILKKKQISFAPSSTKIEGEALEVVQQIAVAMTDCTEVPMEIGGHTDSQGRENMNLTLSQARAEAVLDSLLSHEVLTTFLTAKGYGESQPIADNGTEDGRTANRRIEFRLIGPDDATQEASSASGLQSGDEQDTQDENGLSQPMEEDPAGGATEITDGQD